MRNLIYGVILFTIAQAIIWIQTNGQFVWPWFKKNPFLVSLAGGTLISYVFIKGTWLVAEHFNGALWPGRFIGQASGILIFAFMTWFFLNEGINTKTTISLVLVNNSNRNTNILEMKEIDLHGLTHDEAVLKVENFVLLESQNELFECRIITGNSLKMSTKVIEMLKEHGFRWYVPSWNVGEIIVSF